jgi:UDP-glucose 4-epimerase
MKKIFITGAAGFVGDAIVRRLADEGISVTASVRGNIAPNFPSSVQIVKGCDLCDDFDWSAALSGCDTVIHCAARVHVMKDSSDDPLYEFRRVNVDGTLNLARHSASAGVKRLIFLSSIKVNGEYTPLDSPYTADDEPAPKDPYGFSKREAEDGLRLIGIETGMEIVIIRPPLDRKSVV